MVRVTSGVLMFALGAAAEARAEGPRAEGPRAIDQLAQISSHGPVTVDGGLVLALPATWQTGLSSGAALGASYALRPALVVGAQASWSTATESSLAWTVTHQDMRLRFTGALQHPVGAGRGAFALRLGVGPTLVHEARVRNQGQRAGLTGNELETSAFSLMPAAELEVVVSVHVGGPWLLVMSGGPGLLFSQGNLHGGWTTELGVGWQP